MLLLILRLRPLMWQLLLFPESDDSAQLSQVMENLVDTARWYLHSFGLKAKENDLLDVLDMLLSFLCRLKQKSF